MATRHILLAVSPPNQRNITARVVTVRAVHRTIPFLSIVGVTFLQGLHSNPWSISPRYLALYMIFVAQYGLRYAVLGGFCYRTLTRKAAMRVRRNVPYCNGCRRRVAVTII